MEIVTDLSEFYILYHVVYVRFKFVEFLVLWRAFSRLEAEIVILGVVVVVSAVISPVLVFILFEEKAFQRIRWMTLSVISMSFLMYVFLDGIGIFFIEYLNRVCSIVDNGDLQI